MRTRTNLDQEATRLKEKFFACGNEILRPVRYMINDTYPQLKRDRESTYYDPVIGNEYDKANRRAQFSLYEQRNIVQEKWLPRYNITYVPGGCKKVNADWEELKSLLVDGCLDRLAEMLTAMSPIIVGKDYVEGTQAAIAQVAEVEKRNLTEYLKSFYVVRKPGVPTIEEEME